MPTMDATRTDAEITAHREEQIQKIERLAKQHEDSGKVDEWFKDTDEGVRKISERVNGPLWEALLKQTAFEDPGVAETFRRGAPLAEKLELLEEDFDHSAVSRCLQSSSSPHFAVNTCHTLINP